MKYEAALKLRGACLAAGLTFFSFVAAADQDQPTFIVDVNGGSATVIANDVPVRDVLEKIAMQSGIIIYSRSALDTNVSYSIEEEPIPDLIRRILKRHNFTLHYVSDARTGMPVFGSRLWIFADDATAETPVWSVGQPARDWTLKYAAGDSEKNRLNTVSNLTLQEDTTGAGKELIAAMNDPSVAVREEAVYQLSELQDPSLASYLKNALFDPDKRVRVAAINALAESGDDDATIAISDLLSDEDISIRSEATRALADIGSNIANHYLQQALADANEINRETAAEYLSEFASVNLLK